MSGLRSLVASVPDGKPVAAGNEKSEAIADRNGFTKREPEERLFRKERDTEPSVSLNMRVKLSVSNAFVKYCQDNNLSYPQAMTKILREQGIYEPR
ncbi:hypothetical protein [Aureimonas sp. SK2]|uniref:hypothetical protein n=1 Tax=Aureimonas sp. SK2 TaxID=3015992 RepID=UPI002443B7D8|nr:hypothetical protein [Aureimonas sp. SK2]